MSENRPGLRFPKPGIVVSEWPPEVTARVLGTGIEVWEIVRTYLEVGRDWKRLQTAYEQLSVAELSAALEFARIHAPAIEERIQREYASLPPELRPETAPRWLGE